MNNVSKSVWNLYTAPKLQKATTVQSSAIVVVRNILKWREM